MGYHIIKRTTIIVLLTFFSMILVAQHSINAASEETITDLETAKEFYKDGYYDKAVELFKHFIDKNRGNKTLKNQLIEAYYYKAKICFLGDQFVDMEDTLKNLFQLDLQYNFPGEKNANFLNQAKGIQEILEKQEQERKQIEREKLEKKNKKKYTWVWVAACVVAVTVLIIVLTKKKPSYSLTVTVGDGVEGTPLIGPHTYKKGETVNYNYTLKSGYSNLTVKLDDVEVAPTGAITMDKNHTLTASASKTYSLAVTKGTGVDGTPGTGSSSYRDGETVNYSYTLQNGYQSLVVKIDEALASPNGTILMNANHTLTAYATATYTLTIVKGQGVLGLPDTGSITCPAGENVTYSYYPDNGYTNLTVTLDGVQVAPSGAVIMDQNHTLVISAAAIKKFKLTVTKGTGVDGLPELGNYTYDEGATVIYNYSLKSNYKNLVVTLDGKNVPAGGQITMDRDHALNSSAQHL